MWIHSSPVCAAVTIVFIGFVYLLSDGKIVVAVQINHAIYLFASDMNATCTNSIGETNVYCLLTWPHLDLHLIPRQKFQMREFRLIPLRIQYDSNTTIERFDGIPFSAHNEWMNDMQLFFCRQVCASTFWRLSVCGQQFTEMLKNSWTFLRVVSPLWYQSRIVYHRPLVPSHLKACLLRMSMCQPQFSSKWKRPTGQVKLHCICVMWCMCICMGVRTFHCWHDNITWLIVVSASHEVTNSNNIKCDKWVNRSPKHISHLRHIRFSVRMTQPHWIQSHSFAQNLHFAMHSARFRHQIFIPKKSEWSVSHAGTTNYIA